MLMRKAGLGSSVKLLNSNSNSLRRLSLKELVSVTGWKTMRRMMRNFRMRKRRGVNMHRLATIIIRIIRIADLPPR